MMNGDDRPEGGGERLNLNKTLPDSTGAGPIPVTFMQQRFAKDPGGPIQPRVCVDRQDRLGKVILRFEATRAVCPSVKGWGGPVRQGCFAGKRDLFDFRRFEGRYRKSLCSD